MQLFTIFSWIDDASRLRTMGSTQICHRLKGAAVTYAVSTVLLARLVDG
jgi:hypothetical protein